MRLLSIATLLLLAFAASAQAAASAPVAVVELFTSEGCSSCPPADRVLADLVKHARTSGRRVYALGFHVDYWNSLGWRDPFSDAAYSQRQRKYATALAEEQVYTPQMIVNGQAGFVGSNPARADREIAAALATPATVALAVEARRDGPRVHVNYRAAGAPKGAVVCVAWTESAATTRVARGENAGRTLAHVNVVRSFVTRALEASGAGSVTLSAGGGDAGEVVAFVQDGRSLHVLGASAIQAR